MMGTTLVTGGTGFIGSHLVRLLIELGVPRVIVAGRSGSGASLADLGARVELAWMP